LLPGVTGAGTNASVFVNGAWRPGVDKVTLVPQPMDAPSGAFLPMTNCYTDRYLANGELKAQPLARIVARPDIFFRGGGATPGMISFGL